MRKFSDETFRNCIGMECVYEVYSVNGSWKYKGIIKEVQVNFPYEKNIIVTTPNENDISERVIRASFIIDIPNIKKLINSKIFKVITSV